MIPGSGRSPGVGNGNPLQYSRQEKSHEQRSLVGYGPWGHKESDTTELLRTRAHRDWAGKYPGWIPEFLPNDMILDHL